MALACPHCKGPRTLADKVCASCRFHFESGKVIDLFPPRAAPGARARRDAVRARAQRRWQKLGAYRGHIIAALGLVPGLGHLASREWLRGLAFGGGVLGFMGLSIWLFAGLIGQVLFAVSVGLHAYSIFDLTSWARSPDGRTRMIAVISIQVGLLFAYWPLLVRLANAYVQPVSYRAVRWGSGMATNFFLVVMIGSAIVWALLRYADMPRRDRDDA